jgi:tetratricopeptide (TPR) repeat protein
MIILVVTLAVGLVGSFALWSVPQITKGANSSNLSPEELLKSLNKEIAKYEKELEKNPQDIETILALSKAKAQLASIYTSQGKTDEAKAEYEKVVQLYQQVLDKEPENLEALHGLANAATFTEKPEIAKEATQKALEIQAASKLKIIENIETQLEKDPSNVENITKLADARFQLAYLYLQYNETEKANSEFEKSTELYQQVVEKTPDDADAVYRLALAAFQAGKMDLAQENFEKAVETDPENPGKITNYGVFLMSSSGDFEGAIEQFKKALELNPNENLKTTIQTYIALAEAQLNSNNDSQKNEAENEKEE